MTYKEICGVYKITNKIDGKFYIGSSKHINKRWREHRGRLRNNKHCNTHLQSAWNIYGSDSFEFEVIEEVENPDDIKKREQFWIDILQPFDKNGYNLCKSTNSYTFSHVTSDETRRAHCSPILVE